jgi:hypothetical protein
MPLNIGWGSGSKAAASRKNAVEQVRAKQAEAAKTAAHTGGPSASGLRPIDTQPTPVGKMTVARTHAADAHAAPDMGFMSFVRDCCPNPVFENWFGRTPSSAAERPGAAAAGSHGPLHDSPKGSPTEPLRSEDGSFPLLTRWSSEGGGGKTTGSQWEDALPRADKPAKRSDSLPSRDGVARKRRGSAVSDLRAIPEAGPARPKGPQPEGWSLSDAKVRREKHLSPAAERKFEDFRRHLREGYKPSAAADMLGPGTWMKPLKSSGGRYEIRLNQHDRVTFTIDDAKKEVTIQDVGGHT